MQTEVLETTEKITESTYAEYKAGFDKDMHDTTEGFVKIGYRLRIAEETNILKESGYNSVAEFAAAEYRLTKDQVSRFININKKFSEGGYSPRLKQEYSRFGFSKLAVMLTMEEEINASIPERATKAEIQELSREIKKEKEVTDLEVMMEQKKIELEGLESNLQRAVYQMYYEQPEEKYLATMDALRSAGSEIKDKIKAVYDALAPNGYMMSTFRIPGMGKFMLSIKSREDPVKLVNIRTNEGENFSFEELAEAVLNFCPAGAADGRKAWETVFGKEFPASGNVQAAGVAPEQPKEPEKKTYSAKEAAEKFAEKMAEKKPRDTQTQLPDEPAAEAEKQEELEYKEPEAEEPEKEQLHEQIYKTVIKMQVKILGKNYTETMELCRQMESLLHQMEELQNEV